MIRRSWRRGCSYRRPSDRIISIRMPARRLRLIAMSMVLFRPLVHRRPRAGRGHHGTGYRHRGERDREASARLGFDHDSRTCPTAVFGRHITQEQQGHAMKTFATMTLPDGHDAIAPDGSEVRVLLSLKGGSMAHFRLPAGQVSRAVRHRTVEEI